MDELDEEADEAHDGEADRGRDGNLLELYGIKRNIKLNMKQCEKIIPFLNLHGKIVLIITFTTRVAASAATLAYVSLKLKQLE